MIIESAGMCSPVGYSAAASCAALRAGISVFRELPYLDVEHAPVIGAMVLGLEGVQFAPRLVELLRVALRDCISNAPQVSWDAVPLLLGLAEPQRPGSVASTSADISELVQTALGTRFHPSLSQVLRAGHTAGFEGLRVARELLSSTNVPGCLVCAVDSFINGPSLYWLDQLFRLKREAHMDGLVPGEAAVALYVGRLGKAGEGVVVKGLGFGQEQATLLSGEPLLALGLARAGRAALKEAGWGLHEVDLRLSDVNGETYGFREHTLAQARLADVVRKEQQPIWHAADCIGDTGAAAGLVQLAWLHAGASRGYIPGERVLCFTSSLPGQRAVVAASLKERHADRMAVFHGL